MNAYKLLGLVLVSVLLSMVLGSVLNAYTGFAPGVRASIGPTEGASASDSALPAAGPSRIFLPIVLRNAPLTSGFWALTGNAGTNAATDFIGTTDNMTFAIKVNNVVGWRLIPTASTPNLIGGHGANVISSTVLGATIAGGGSAGNPNRVTDSFGTVGGGAGNRAGDLGTSDAFNATVGGGYLNTASGGYSTVGGGYGNIALAQSATVGGGRWNQATGEWATVGGGDRNQAKNTHATVGGGEDNQATEGYATVCGGISNVASGVESTIAGGAGNYVSGSYATLGGGVENGVSGAEATVGGGQENIASGNTATVGGGYYNHASGADATVGGGTRNTASGLAATVGGGGSDGQIAKGNIAGGMASTVGGGYSNTVSVQANYGFIGGGRGNFASGQDAAIAGGAANTASGAASAVPGGYLNKAQGANSFAGGTMAEAWHDGSFVWADNNYEVFNSAGPNQFRVRASGGVYFFTSNTVASGMYLPAGGSGWGVISDRQSKTNLETLDPRLLLERLVSLPISKWSFKTQDASIRHIGPMAQDWYAAFGVGEDNTHINSIDADGVALSAIQGLYEIVQEKQVRIAAQDKRIAELEKQNASFEARLTALERGTPIQVGGRPYTDPAAWLPWGALLLVGVWLVRRQASSF